MLSIVMLGTGNVARHLFNVLSLKKNLHVKQVYGRSLASLEPFKDVVSATTSLNQLLPADIYLIAVSDGAINSVSAEIKHIDGLVAHTSGNTGLSALKTKRKGVFYPLQTFTKNKNIDFSNIPICIEAENQVDYLLLEELGTSISSTVHRISTEQRQKLHLNAVLVNNFTNHLFHWANELCEASDISFELLYPLISETADKLKHLSPFEAQTGPARRHDVATMQNHLEQLENPLQKKIYQLMSESIKSLYEKKL